MFSDQGGKHIALLKIALKCWDQIKEVSIKLPPHGNNTKRSCEHKTLSQKLKILFFKNIYAWKKSSYVF